MNGTDRAAATQNAEWCPKGRRCHLSSPVGQMRLRMKLRRCSRGIERMSSGFVCDHALFAMAKRGEFSAAHIDTDGRGRFASADAGAEGGA